MTEQTDPDAVLRSLIFSGRPGGTRFVGVEVLAQILDALAQLRDERDAATARADVALARVREIEQWQAGWNAYLTLLTDATIPAVDSRDSTTSRPAQAAHQGDGRGDPRSPRRGTDTEVDRAALQRQRVLREQDREREPTPCHPLTVGRLPSMETLRRRAASPSCVSATVAR